MAMPTPKGGLEMEAVLAGPWQLVGYQRCDLSKI